MKTLPWVIIALLLLVILYLRECSPKVECLPPRVDTIPGDTVIQDTIIYKPHLVYRDTGSSHWYREKIDTAAILAACLAVNCYRDTLKNDTSALVAIENEVSMNELQRTRMEFLKRRERKLIFISPSRGVKMPRLIVGSSLLFSHHIYNPGLSFHICKDSWKYGITYFPNINSVQLNLCRGFN
ncbi:MAG: hypothetical protein NTU44_04710 [Bacteroidetes bacterium]|nr:hypothetical protein [Bacteroidota bacterium]